MVMTDGKWHVATLRFDSASTKAFATVHVGKNADLEYVEVDPQFKVLMRLEFTSDDNLLLAAASKS